MNVANTIAAIEQASQRIEQDERERNLRMAYAHRIMSPPLSLATLSRASGLGRTTVRERVRAFGSDAELIAALRAAGIMAHE